MSSKTLQRMYNRLIAKKQALAVDEISYYKAQLQYHFDQAMKNLK